MKQSVVFFVVLIGFASPAFAEFSELHVQRDESVWASSSLSEKVHGREVTYGPEALFDPAVKTPWVEGVAGDGIGEYVLVLTQRPVAEVEIVNGFAASEALFAMNGRVASFELSLVAGFTAPALVTELGYWMYFVRELGIPEPIVLADTARRQRFEFPIDSVAQRDFFTEVLTAFSERWPDLTGDICSDLRISPDELDDPFIQNLVFETYGFFALRLTIAAVYPGSRYDDTCVSGLAFTLERF